MLIYSTVQKRHKENPDQVNGDYYANVKWWKAPLQFCNTSWVEIQPKYLLVYTMKNKAMKDTVPGLLCILTSKWVLCTPFGSQPIFFPSQSEKRRESKKKRKIHEKGVYQHLGAH